MAEKDIYAKKYMGKNAVFADAFNVLLYHGRQRIRPEQLSPLDSVEVAAPYGKAGNMLALERIRDNIRLLSSKEDGTAAYLLLGIDTQSKPHLAMPVRNMLYDSLSYVKQIEDIRERYRQEHDYGKDSEEFLSGLHRDDKLLPVITAVVNLSSKPWDGPLRLYDMLEIEDPELRHWVQDFKIHLIDPHRMSEADLDLFQTDLGLVLKWMKYANDKDRLYRMVREGDYAKTVSADAVRVIESHTNTKLKYRKDEEEIDMCLAMDMLLEEAEIKGETRGRAEGREEGENRLAQLILRLKKDGRTADIVTAADDIKIRNEMYRLYGI